LTAQEAAEIRLRAERKAGEGLVEMGKRGERAGRGDAQKSQPATFQLADLQINKSQSSRWQAIAEIPGPVFEDYIREVSGPLKAGISDLVARCN